MNLNSQLFRSKFRLALILILLVLSMGVMGYMGLAGYSFLDALYMTVITVTTVGYRELVNPDEETKLFTIILIITSVFVFAFALSVITDYVVSRNTPQTLRLKKLRKKMRTMKDHIIICGYGRNGKQAAAKLAAHQKPFVVIEQKKEVIERYEEEVTFIMGNANEDDVLMEAGIEKAQCLITALPSDADNLFVVLTARQLNPHLHIISRASEETSQAKLRFAGANNVIMPDRIGGEHMASLVVTPDLVEFIDNLSLGGDHAINLEEICIQDIPESSKYKSIRDLDLRKRTGCTVIGYKDVTTGKYVVNPDADLKLTTQSKLIVLGRPEQILKLNSLFRT